MTRRRGLLYHFTHISNLASVAEDGLFSDTQIAASRRAPTEGGRRFVFTDRNAALRVARYGNQLVDLDDYLDWDLMEGRMWNDTDEEPDRMERRMAEFLVHGRVPWSAFIGVAARDDEKCRQVEHALASVGAEILVTPRPEWYF